MSLALTLARAMRGVWAVFRGEADSDRWFELGPDGFWRSFLAVPITLPLAAALVSTGAGDDFDAGGLLAGLAAYLISWFLFVGACIPFLRVLGLLGGYTGFVTCYNWAQVPIAALPLPFVVASAWGILPNGAATVALTLVFLVSLALVGRIARVTLGATPVQTVAIVLFETVLSWSLQNWFSRLFG